MEEAGFEGVEPMGGMDREEAISEQPGDQASDIESARDLAQRMDKIFAL